ncbi:MAG: hypothetical protein RLZZ511_4097, partial [Cyanobacteriota bacterium]
QCLNPHAELSQFFQPHALHLKGYDEAVSAYGCGFEQLDQCLKLIALPKPKSTSNLA